jgi:site-specific recombinase XerD
MDGEGPAGVFAYKRVRNEGSSDCTSDLFESTQAKISSSVDRQFGNVVLHSEQRGEKESKNESVSQESLGVDRGKEMSVVGGIHKVERECGSRYGQQREGFFGLETSCRSFPAGVSDFRSSVSRLVCEQSKPSVRKICESETRSKSMLCECVSVGLVENASSVLLPAFQVHNESVEEVKGKPVRWDHDYSVLGNQYVVSVDSRNVDRKTSVVTGKGGSSEGSSGTVLPIDCAKKDAVGGLESLRKSLEDKGISKESAVIMLGARSSGTTKGYESNFAIFSSWCGERSEDPFCCDLNVVLRYLTEMFEAGKAYRTINAHRSAISLFHKEVEGLKVGKHPDVCLLLKGVGKIRPPEAKYAQSWEVGRVLNYLRSLGENKSMSLRDLAQKTVVLVALVSIARSLELHRLRLDLVCEKEDLLIFQIPGIVKHSRQGKSNPPIIVHKFESESQICPMQAILDYRERTANVRKEVKQQALFISSISPFNPLAKTTIANYIKQVLRKAGIDTGFTAHSTRAAGSSKAKGGVSVEVILKRGNWSNSSTFERFYHKKVDQDGKRFQDEVLS